jgi:hypothetical protein
MLENYPVGHQHYFMTKQLHSTKGAPTAYPEKITLP